ncbi:MAG: 6-carboxytetrahydropterin synthase [Sedimentisphaerales bacterium]|nr:6-carboxytetrahydropterin synthase [Sedimentisphaerales bacterium]
MHKLARQVRFAVDPFAEIVSTGANSYCAKPTADAMAIFFALWVELTGKADKDTGFVINVSDIDKIVRDKAVVLFCDCIKQNFEQKKQVSFEQLGQVLAGAWQTIEKDFTGAKIEALTLEFAPARKLTIKENGGNMLYFSEKFEFAASHTLWNDKFSNDENMKTFGKCANPTGHGHNYIVEVTIKKSTADAPLHAGNFEQIVSDNFITLVDHKNLNTDIDHFKKINPTVENIAEFAFNRLADKFKPFELDCITVWENDRTFCSYRAG